MDKFEYKWQDLHNVTSTHYTCGYCGENISSDKGYLASANGRIYPFIFICHSCNKPSFIRQHVITPAAPLGRTVAKLPDDIEQLYEEIRGATSVNAYTAAVMTARKLLMHIAVEKGAKENKKFVEYVDYLEINHFTPPNSKSWVDKIRQLGNGANHEITIMGAAEAQTILTFLEMLLKFIYEFPEIETETPEPGTGN